MARLLSLIWRRICWSIISKFEASSSGFSDHKRKARLLGVSLTGNSNSKAGEGNFMRTTCRKKVNHAATAYATLVQKAIVDLGVLGEQRERLGFDRTFCAL